jgi:hypothetical protein
MLRALVPDEKVDPDILVGMRVERALAVLDPSRDDDGDDPVARLSDLRSCPPSKPAPRLPRVRGGIPCDYSTPPWTDRGPYVPKGLGQGYYDWRAKQSPPPGRRPLREGVDSALDEKHVDRDVGGAEDPAVPPLETDDHSPEIGADSEDAKEEKVAAPEEGAEPAVDRQAAIDAIRDALKARCAALLDRRDFDEPADVMTYRRGIYNQALHSDLAKLGVNVHEFVDKIIHDMEQDVLVRRNATSKARAVSNKILSTLTCFLRGLILSPLPNVKIKGAPMERVLARERFKFKSLRVAGVAGIAAHYAAMAGVVVVRATAEEVVRSRLCRSLTDYLVTTEMKARPQIPGILASFHPGYGTILKGCVGAASRPEQAKIALYYGMKETLDRSSDTNAIPEYAIDAHGDPYERTKTYPVVDRDKQIKQQFAHFSLGLTAVGFSVFECVRTGASKKEFLFRLAGHTALGLLSYHCHISVAVAAHATINLAALWLRPGWMLDVTRTRSHSAPVVEDLCLQYCKVKTVKTQEAFVVHRPPEPVCVPAFGARGMWSVAGLYADVNRHCCHNEVISLEARVGKHLPQHEVGGQDVAKAEWKKLTAVTLPHVTGLVRPVTTPIPLEEWLKPFPPAKREMYLKLVNESELMPALVASSFVKKELVLREPNSAAIVKDPRMIQGCPPMLSLKCGPFIRKAAKALKSGLKPTKWLPDSVKTGKHIVYTCGMSAESIGISYSKAIDLIRSMCGPGERVVVLEDDQSRFDLHITEPAFEHIDACYSALLPKKVARLLRRGPQSMGKTKLGCKYSIPYTMQSGWPDTSYGDSAANACMKLYIHGIGNKWISLICGDDSVTVTTDVEITKLGNEQGIVAAYAKLGMEIEVVIRPNPDLAEFCSARFYPHGTQYVLMPKPGKLIAKLGWDMVDRSPGNQIAWVRGVTSTLLHFGHIDPILGALGRSLSRQTGEGKRIAYQYNEYKATLCGGLSSAPMADVYYYYMTHYDLTVSEVDYIITYFDSDKLVLGVPCADPLIVGFCRTDL